MIEGAGVEAPLESPANGKAACHQALINGDVLTKQGDVELAMDLSSIKTVSNMESRHG